MSAIRELPCAHCGAPIALRHARVAALFFLVATALHAEAVANPPAAAVTAAAQAFLATLDPGERRAASLPFNSEERLDWGYVPRERRGLPLKQMRPATRDAAARLLGAALSARGASTVDTIASLEDALLALEGWRGRDRALYYVTIFGEPAERGAWGWRYEGHHVSLNWTILDGAIVGSSPQFLGANPAAVRAGPLRGTRALAAEEDLARAFMASLAPAQRSRALLAASAPRDILTGSARQAGILERRGLAWRDLDSSQQGLLMSLLQEYAALQAPAVAESRLAKIRPRLPSVVFAWMGGIQRGEGHYYRIQGESFLVEYDNTQDGANHIHSVWREFHGDWGADALAVHYRTAAHHARPRAAASPVRRR
jgi:hypothetical protein